MRMITSLLTLCGSIRYLYLGLFVADQPLSDLWIYSGLVLLALSIIVRRLR